ncbi:MAG TPA: hypothetical protein VNW04_20320 [Puia sp.]|jgi:hypothetical protein|nr:hypothetical protein [Puia sp.]
MASYISGMPTWASALFIASFLYSIAFIAKPAKQAALDAGMTPASARNIQFGIFGFYVLYLAYAAILALAGFFDVDSIPPRVMIFTAIPLAILLLGVVENTKLFRKLLRAITLESLIALHVFRVLGVFDFLLYFYHLLPRDFAFSAGAGDIITAILALPVAKMVAKGKPGSLKIAYAWNIFGTLDIIVLLVIVVITVKNAAVTGGPGIREMTVFPFVWFAAFAPATILFLHVAIFRKLRQRPAEVLAPRTV